MRLDVKRKTIFVPKEDIFKTIFYPMCLNTIPPVSVVGVCVYQMVPPLLIKAHY